MYVYTMYKIVTYVRMYHCNCNIFQSLFSALIYVSVSLFKPAHTCFLDIAFVQEVGMRGLCVCI